MNLDLTLKINEIMIMFRFAIIILKGIIESIIQNIRTKINLDFVTMLHHDCGGGIMLRWCYIWDWIHNKKNNAYIMT